MSEEWRNELVGDGRMNRPQAILLDCYGTIVAEDDDVVAAACRSIARTATAPGSDPATIGRYWSEVFRRLCTAAAGPAFATLRELERRSLRQTVRHFGSRADVESLSRRLFDHWRRPPIFDDTAPFLAGIGLPVCLVSDIDRADLDSVLDTHRLDVDGVVTSEQAQAYKPRPEPFRLALDQLGLAPTQVWHVGDSLSADVAGANALGIPAVWVNRSGRRRPVGTQVAAEVTDLASIGDLVRSAPSPPR